MIFVISGESRGQCEDCPCECLSYNVVSCWVTACDCVVCHLMAVVLSVATILGCLMTMLKTTGRTDTYCPEDYCEPAYVWSSANSGECKRESNTYR